MTTPQEEAERRYLSGIRAGFHIGDYSRRRAAARAFTEGAEWLADEIGLTPEQVQRLGPLVEAARKYGVGVAEYEVAWKALQEHFNAPEYATAVQVAYWKRETGGEELLAAAADLDGGTEAERPPESSS